MDRIDDWAAIREAAQQTTKTAKAFWAETSQQAAEVAEGMRNVVAKMAVSFVEAAKVAATGRPAMMAIARAADEALEENDLLSEADKDELRSARDDFMKNMAAFIEAQGIDENVRFAVSGAILEAAFIGSLAGNPEIISRLINNARAAQKSAQAEHMRQAKLRKAGKRQEALQWAILEAANGEQLIKSDKFANRLLPAVLKCLPEDYDQSKVTPTAIKKEIIAMCSVAVEKAIYESAFADDPPEK